MLQQIQTNLLQDLKDTFIFFPQSLLNRQENNAYLYLS